MITHDLSITLPDRRHDPDNYAGKLVEKASATEITEDRGIPYTRLLLGLSPSRSALQRAPTEGHFPAGPQRSSPADRVRSEPGDPRLRKVRRGAALREVEPGRFAAYGRRPADCSASNDVRSLQPGTSEALCSLPS